MFETGTIKPGEICPGMTWEDHADSVARFMSHMFTHEFGTSNLPELRELILEVIDGDPNEVKDRYAESERNS